MGVKHEKLKKMMENYLNIIKNEEVETWYGKNCHIKIHNIIFSVTETSVLIEAVIFLGDIINEEVLDRGLVELLIIDMMPYFFPEVGTVRVMTRYDV